MEYRGYTIRKTQDPWPIHFGMYYEYFADEKLHYSPDIENAKLEIDERIAEQENRLSKGKSLTL